MRRITYDATVVWRENDTSGGRRARAATLVALLGLLMSASGTAFTDERSDIFGGGAGPVLHGARRDSRRAGK